MVLEATMICLDNSDWARNEDFTPSRLDAQQDAANLVCGAKTQDNPENAVGLLVMGGQRVHVSVAPTPDTLAFLQALHGIPSHGKADLIRGIQTAQLALKHRLNRNQRQRIVLFVCSPVSATEKQLEQLGKALKKNNVALDIVSFGEVEGNSRLLQKLYQTVNSNDTSHLIEITDPSQTLTRHVMRSAIVATEGGAAPGAGGELDEFGVDPSADPELYMALRLSLEEERARARQATADQTGGQVTGGVPVEETAADSSIVEQTGGPTAGLQPVDPAPPTVQPEADMADRPPTVDEIYKMDIDQDLRQALLLSLRELEAAESTQQKRSEPSPPPLADDPEQKRRRTAAEAAPSDPHKDAVLMAQVVKNLAGVDVNSPEVQEALRAIPGSSSATPRTPAGSPAGGNGQPGKKDGETDEEETSKKE